MKIIDNDLLSIQEARILVENARDAQAMLALFPQEKLDMIVEHMLIEIDKYNCELAHMSSDETDYGRWQDKCIKNHFICEYLQARLKGMQCVGIIQDDVINKTMDIGVPVGVIVSLCPATNPVSTAIYKAVIAIKSGNAMIFSPHPRARKTTARALDILIQVAEEYGLPEGALSYLHTVTRSGTMELMNHQDTSFIMNTGVPAMLKRCYNSGKPVIYGGAGNGPAFIERTADIKQAVEDIILSKTFDYGIVSAAEQSIVVDRVIADDVKRELQNNGGHFLTEEEAKRLGKLLFLSDGNIDPEMVGKSAKYLAKQAGISVSDEVRLLISPQKYVYEANPYSKEKLCPVLAYYIEDDWMHACEKCIELLLSERNGHTLVIHSKDMEVIQQFALKKPVGRVLVNTPATFGSMGATTNLFPAMTLGSGSAGRGITSDNVSPMNLIYVRKVGYGIRKADSIIQGAMAEVQKQCSQVEQKNSSHEKEQMLQFIIKNVIQELRNNKSGAIKDLKRS